MVSCIIHYFRISKEHEKYQKYRKKQNEKKLFSSRATMMINRANIAEKSWELKILLINSFKQLSNALKRIKRLSESIPIWYRKWTSLNSLYELGNIFYIFQAKHRSFEFVERQSIDLKIFFFHNMCNKNILPTLYHRVEPKHTELYEYILPREERWRRSVLISLAIC